MANKVVFVAGSPGAGKTTIIQRVAANKGYKVVNVGGLMTKIAVKKDYVKDRDQIRYLDRKRFEELQVLAFKEVSKMNGNIILDTHATIEQNGRYLPGISIGHTKHLGGLAALVYIDALTNDITKRRKGDSTRRRENEKRELIDVQRLMNVSLLSACSSYLNLPFYVIFNEQGKLNRSVQSMKVHLKEVFGV